MIVKIQVSQFASGGVKRCLIYSKDRSVTLEKDLGEYETKLMAGRSKAYFDATVVPKGLEIGDEVPAEDW